MKEHQEQHGVVGPLILISAGGLLLASRMGVAIDFVAILRLWPLLLIAGGIDLLIGRRSVYGALIAALLIVAMFGGAFWLFGVTDSASIETESFHVELADFESLDLALDPAVGRIAVESMEGDSTDALAAEISTVFGEAVDTRVSERGDTQVVSIRADGMWTGRSVGQWDRQSGWEVALNPTLMYSIDIDMGVGQLDLDLTGIELEDLNIDMGVGQTVLRLPDGSYRVQVDGGVGDLLVYVPRNAAMRIVTDTGITGRSIPPDFNRSGDQFESPNFDADEDGLTLYFAQAIGSLRVIYLP